MKYLVALLFSMLLFEPAVLAQDSVLPRHVVISERLNYDKYTSYIIPSVNWLQNTPLNRNPAERRRLDNFIMAWLQKNKEVTVTIPEFLVKFQSINNEFYFLYNGNWIKYVLQTGDTNVKNCLLVAVRAMLNYYDNKMGVKKNDYMDYLVQLEKAGKLPSLLDTNAQNTYLFLRPDYTQKVYGPNENYFNFRYTAINFIDPRGLTCRYKLEGYYDRWVPVNDVSVIFPNLPAGDYTFRLQASIYPDFHKMVEKSYSFTVLAPLWKRPWFITLVLLILGAAAYWYARQRVKTIKDVAMLQQQRVKFEYDHLRSQINPHFLFNSLNTLTSLIEEDAHRAVEYSSHLSDLYRNVLAYSSEDLVFIKEELEILSNYTHIQKVRFGEALQMRIDISEELKRTRKIVPLALQLLVENAMKHNVVSLSNPLVVTISADEQHLTVSNNIRPKFSKEKGVGLGLVNITKRYALATDKQIEYGAEGNNYVVRIPLL